MTPPRSAPYALPIPPSTTYKEAIGFLVLILVLVARPQGIFGQARTV